MSTDPSESAIMNRLEKLKNDVYSFEELDTLEKNAIKLRDQETLSLIISSRASKKAKGEKPKSTVDANGVPLTKRGRRDAKAGRQRNLWRVSLGLGSQPSVSMRGEPRGVGWVDINRGGTVRVTAVVNK